MRFTAQVVVTLKPGVLDPQGKAVGGTLNTLGYQTVKEVRVGKYMTLELDAPDLAAAEEQVKEFSRRVLSNPVIEEYKFTIAEASA